jgi:hypothetical protein
LVIYGITEEELREHLGTLLKDSHGEAEQNDTQNSADIMEMVMDDFQIGGTVVDRKQEFLYHMKAAPSITVRY